MRVNGVGTRWFDDDLAAAAELELDAIVLPKATPEAVAALGPDGPPVIAIVETAQGLRLAYETASSPRVAALLLGAVDLGAELGLEPRPDGLEILYARSKVVADSAAAGIRAPVRRRPRRHPATTPGWRRQRAFARSLGFRGKACIHPAQVPIVNRVFAPGGDRSPGRSGWSRRPRRASARARRGRAGRRDDRPARRRARAADPGGRERRGAWPLTAHRHRRSGGPVLRGPRRRRRLPQPLRPHGHGVRQHPLHRADAQHELDPLR